MNSTTKKLLLRVLKDFNHAHSVTSLAEILGLSRVGTWKILKKLASHDYIKLSPVGKGKTSTALVSLNWEDELVMKALVLFLSEEAGEERRWQASFAELEDVTDFLVLFGSILHSPAGAKDIDLLSLTAKEHFIEVDRIVERIQKSQLKKVHAIHFTEKEMRSLLKKPNKALTDALQKGIVLYGQERFVGFMKEVSRHG